MTALISAKHRITTTDNIKLAAFTYGDSTLPPLVLVHGYPDHHSVWEKVIPYLVTRFFVIAYDVRGAGHSDKPPFPWSYGLTQLSEDLQAVTQQIIGDKPFHLAAHDWGSLQSWESVTDPAWSQSGPKSGKILSYSTMSGPCLDHVALYLRSISDQPIKVAKLLRKSWYIGVFHLPFIAPIFWQNYSPKQWQKHVQMLENTQDIPLDNLIQVNGKKGIALYRANFLLRNVQPRERFAQCPVQAIEFIHDKFVSAAYIDTMPRWVKNFYKVSVDANHWGILSQPEVVANHIGDFASQFTQ